jgi:hypothetical protein
MDEIEQRKRQAKEAGYDNPFCASCHSMSDPAAKVCRDCMRDTPAFSKAVREFLTMNEGAKQ